MSRCGGRFAPRFVAILAAVALDVGSTALATGFPEYARHGMVVSGSAPATNVGLEVLTQGGNAFDAAVATAFALAVTHPIAGNLAGGGFCVGLAGNEPFALDFREVAPAAATRDLFLDDRGDVIPDRSLRTHAAVGVPGTVDGLLALLDRYGSLPRDSVLAPAIALARAGHAVTPFTHFALVEKRGLIEPFPETARTFFPGGSPLAFGAHLVQEDLARSLERIARDGRDGFYEGETADLLVAEIARGGGVLAQGDLSGYRSRWREPIVFADGSYELITHPPPSSGGITIAQILGLLDDPSGELAALGFQSAEYVRRLVEAERLAYADRNHWLGDPDFVDVPVARLLGPDYLAARRAELPDTGAAGASDRVAAGPAGGEPVDGETTHLVVVDAAGNVVSLTTTLNTWFGMGAVVPGAGFFLNNEMDDFSAKPGVPNVYGLVGTEANAIGPGKRMLSSMAPTIVRKNGAFLLAMGSPGGSTIITTVLQVYLNVTRFSMNVRDAIDAPRFHHQWLPDRIELEPRALSPDTRSRLSAMGYSLHERTGAIGRVMGVERRADGLLAGHADRRSGGSAAGY